MSKTQFEVRLSSVYRELTDLKDRTLRHPAQLPDVWIEWSKMPLEDRSLVGLVLDGILELRWVEGCGTGAAALPLYQDWAPPAPSGPLAEKSIRAIRLAEKSESTSPVELAQWLYDFGRTPPRNAEVRTGKWDDSLLTVTDQMRLESLYSHQIGKWDVWSHSSSHEITRAPRHKLYISPHIDDLDLVVHEATDLLCTFPVPAFKITPDRKGATRPDKLIVYFHCLRELERWACLLAGRVEHYKAHGVPFTFQLNRTGLLSRALDPETEEDRKEESWRSWCTDRLGWSLAIAKLSESQTPSFPPWHFALFRLTVDRVDVSRWCLFEEPLN